MKDFNVLAMEKIAENKAKAKQIARDNLERYLSFENIREIYKNIKRLNFELSKKEFEKIDTNGLENHLKRHQNGKL